MAYFNNIKHRINFGKNAINKFLVTHELFHTSFYNENLLSCVISRLHQVNATKLSFQNVDIPYNDFLFLTSHAESVSLSLSNVKNLTGLVVPLEKLIADLPKLKSIDLYDNHLQSISLVTVKELFKIPHFKNIENLEFIGLPDSFDIGIFFAFIKVCTACEFQVI
uniref:Uncharacterized protein n=1 Tax=Panagrolaimus sp. ES5 TaxID=591445 RepID=A0AC34F6X5_9BILA